ncbi:acyltransferase family protein [Schleiferilactobacillus perolens]|uniref:Acyltransferase 3 n=1 Tax=Schleiferilactobacillus perolens DSM 12744 TaxID=1423792 RepID=A0A0R1N881_9LACO|nr:acyltransferase family protein [Schleiferilactobacillus perolens]KRL13083.1 acyltransferase 3 [Schleiferilactobacillus perolens DSM 12744]
MEVNEQITHQQTPVGSVRPSKKRIAWVDIAKAIGILAVVAGHAYPHKDALYEVIYWWHMPLFYFIGGFFIKPLGHSWTATRKFLKRKIWPLYRDYLIAGSAIIFINYFTEHRSLDYSINYFGRLLYGGTVLNGYTSAFWFVTVYIIAHMAVVALITYIQPQWLQWLTVIGLFALGTGYDNAKQLFGFPLPGNADVALMAMFYMYAGYRLFPLLKRVISSRILFGASVLGAFGFAWAQYADKIDQVLYMKSHNVTNGIFAATVPILFVLVVIGIANRLAKTNFAYQLQWLGKQSMIIMFSHKAIFYILEKLSITNWGILAMFGVLIPIIGVLLYHSTRSMVKSIVETPV